MIARYLAAVLAASVIAMLLAFGIVRCTLPAAAHDWYGGYKTLEFYDGPPSGIGRYEEPTRLGCCNNGDCREYPDAREVSTGILFPSLGYVAPWERVQPSADGKWHACFNRGLGDKVPRCIFGPLPSY